MRTLAWAVLTGALLMPPAWARAESPAYNTSMGMRDACRHALSGGAAVFNDGVCYGFVYGMTEALKTTGTKPLYCQPANVTNKQAVLVWEKYLDDHPEKLNEPPGATFTVALFGAWPCPAK